MHEVFVALPRVIKRYQGESSLRSFLTGVAINHARHHVRSAGRRRAMLVRAGKEPHPESHSPESSAERRAFLQALNRALDTLPLDQRVAFVLCDVEERTSAEAAEMTGAPEATMRTLLAHCGLEWRDACLRFHENPAPTPVASAADVRRPIYRESVDLWRSYRQELAPLARLLAHSGIAV